MTEPMWNPDGTWRGSPAPGAPAQAEPVERASTSGTAPENAFSATGCAPGCLTGVGLLLVLPALLLALVTVSLGLGEQTTTTVGTVTAIEPGVNRFGDATPYCYTVEYSVDAQAHMHRTCSSVMAPDPDRPAETGADADGRFAALHPVGSRVKVRYVVDDPSRATGAVSDLDSFGFGGGPRTAAVAGALTLAFLVGCFLALRAARRRRRARRLVTTG